MTLERVLPSDIEPTAENIETFAWDYWGYRLMVQAERIVVHISNTQRYIVKDTYSPIGFVPSKQEVS